jgi:hypothetical protein
LSIVNCDKDTVAESGSSMEVVHEGDIAADLIELRPDQPATIG